jgi:16S rRNA (cytosine967-C5)-methyltransferase
VSLMSMNVWEAAADLLVRHLARGLRLDALLETLPSQITATERRRCQHLVFGAVRHRGLLDHALSPHLRRTPRPRLRAVLLLGAFELLEHPENAPAIVHHTVERARTWTSAAEARVVNAVLRRASGTLRAELEREPKSAAELALRYSHPEWLVKRWLARWGDDATRRLLTWNQEPAPVYARRIGNTNTQANAALPPSFQPTAWSEFFRLARPAWHEVEQLLGAGQIYLQDPATAIAPTLLGAQPGETLLDLCAAPGGKTLQLAEGVGRTGRVTAVDLPGARLDRLRENLARYPQLPVIVVSADVSRITPATLGAAGTAREFDGVLLDVPCSNTGVLRHRVDAKWRLNPADLVALPQLQLTMLARAADVTKPGGRLVYSTCSLEPEENEEVVHRFLETHRETFALETTRASLPWESACDGATAFLLRRTKPPAR